MAVNHLADRSSTELKMMRGFRRSKNYGGIQGLPFNMSEFAGASVPDQMDWRLYGTLNDPMPIVDGDIMQ